MHWSVRTLAQTCLLALGRGTECEAERDKLKLQVLDLNQQLVLAGTETVQDRCRPCPHVTCHSKCSPRLLLCLAA